MSYFYKGRHRAPTKAGKRTAALLAGVAVPFGAAGTAAASDLPPDSIVECESGGDIRAQNPVSTASGKYQFIDGTWLAYGGGKYASKAKYATEAQQDEIAAKLWAAEGSAPWNASKHCWGGQDMSPGTAAAAPQRDVEPVAEPQKAPATTQTQKAVEQAPRVAAQGHYTQTEPRDYEIQQGDTLTSIARVHDTSADALFEANTDVVEHRDLIFPGEHLHIR